MDNKLSGRVSFVGGKIPIFYETKLKSQSDALEPRLRPRDGFLKKFDFHLLTSLIAPQIVKSLKKGFIFVIFGLKYLSTQTEF